MNLKKLQETIEKIGSHLPPKDDWLPVLIVENKKEGSIFGFAGDSMVDSQTKDLVAEHITRIITELNPDCACFVTTAWTVEGGLSELDIELWKSGAVKLSEHPRRVEIVNAYCYGERGPNEGEALMFGYIERFPDKAPRIKKWKILSEDGTTAEGRFPEAIRDGFLKARNKQT